MIGRSEIAALAAGILWMLSGEAHAAEHWQKLATAPYTLNNKQDALAFVDSDRGWYGNGTGRVYRTVDGGTHWRLIWKHPGTYVRSLAFSDAETGFLGNVGPGYFPDVADTNPLYVTRDGGTTWQAVRDVRGPRVSGICAIDVVKKDGKLVAVRAGGRVGGPAGMIESLDGRTWHSRDMSAYTGMILDIHFVDGVTGFIAGASQSDESRAHARILKTRDGGATWHAVFESSRAEDVNWKLAFPSSKVGYATIISYGAPSSEARGYVVKTDDGGEHWHPLVVTRDHDWIPYGIAFVDEVHGWVGGASGGYETLDGGRTWRKASMGLSTNKFQFARRADGGVTVFAIGHDLYRLTLPPGQHRS